MYREAQPWPIRHIIRCVTPCDKDTIKNDYYRTYYRFSDDCFRGFDKMDDALDFEQELKMLLHPNHGTNERKRMV